MTLTTFPQSSSTARTSPDLRILNLSRLLTRLEHNLLSPSADLKGLRRNEYQRMRIAANVEYARTLLSQLERTLPTLKPLDRRHELQTDLTRKRQTLKLLQDVLDRSSAEAEMRQAAETDPDSDEEDEIILDGEEEEAVTVTPEAGSTSSASEGNRDTVSEEAREEVHAEAEGEAEYETDIPKTTLQTTASTTTAPPPSATATAAATTTTTTTLRHRHQRGPTAATDSTAIATGSATSKLQETEQTLDAHRVEQEDLTSSLLSLATQLKASSQAFHSSLEAEKSVLARAVEGLDRTTTNMGAAEKRMGMLRRMTEGKGWWGRMMLYAWIFGLWIVAVLIVFLGPKLRL
ncbi:hypothetical protein IFM58399_01423 [Aspergillus lentulus]|uniref:Synaptobrevin n=1 Tax=Aspergillus lentulus TaxID=293939 RepID=A0AAN5YU67_ASPLE|nr:uncharacterized protein IFM58399_01423 [Aspergillus lentulus]KAF4156094.1 hypothetical protein CNMCM6069_007188 [Aspergillus lentulus]KAF4168941.1 hypothetical protein CNMCM6936_000352 [Aspergillus lentulus]KAF4182418.1 hypothetical protein CNMCM8060_006822 [Aspergillus lentulus]KAF4184862.1 hypothetical protein CNMCM7927_007489 [Aspergillus lentulus]KAF4199085.1 hypothetical protein CNMCM8694_006838 [Aspergillus lentulus]